MGIYLLVPLIIYNAKKKRWKWKKVIIMYGKAFLIYSMFALTVDLYLFLLAPGTFNKVFEYVQRAYITTGGVWAIGYLYPFTFMYLGMLNLVELIFYALIPPLLFSAEMGAYLIYLRNKKREEKAEQITEEKRVITKKYENGNYYEAYSLIKQLILNHSAPKMKDVLKETGVISLLTKIEIKLQDIRDNIKNNIENLSDLLGKKDFQQVLQNLKQNYELATKYHLEDLKAELDETLTSFDFLKKILQYVLNSSESTFDLNDLADALGIDRNELFDLVVEWRKLLTMFKLEGNKLLYTEDKEIASHLHALEAEFEDWGYEGTAITMGEQELEMNEEFEDWREKALGIKKSFKEWEKKEKFEVGKI